MILAAVGNIIGDEGLSALSEALKLNNSVTTIALSGEFVLVMKAAVMLAVVDNQIGVEGVKALSEVLTHNSNSVTTIVLSSSEFVMLVTNLLVLSLFWLL